MQQGGRMDSAELYGEWDLISEDPALEHAHLQFFPDGTFSGCTQSPEDGRWSYPLRRTLILDLPEEEIWLTLTDAGRLLRPGVGWYERAPARSQITFETFLHRRPYRRLARQLRSLMLFLLDAVAPARQPQLEYTPPAR